MTYICLHEFIGNAYGSLFFINYFSILIDVSKIISKKNVLYDKLTVHAIQNTSVNITNTMKYNEWIENNNRK